MTTKDQFPPSIQRTELLQIISNLNAEQILSSTSNFEGLQNIIIIDKCLHLAWNKMYNWNGIQWLEIANLQYLRQNEHGMGIPIGCNFLLKNLALWRYILYEVFSFVVNCFLL